MHNRMTSKSRKPARQGSSTLPAQGETTQSTAVPRLPHEHDESADSQTHGEASGKRTGQQAHADVRRGLVDTSKSTEMDTTYRKVKSGR